MQKKKNKKKSLTGQRFNVVLTNVQVNKLKQMTIGCEPRKAVQPNTIHRSGNGPGKFQWETHLLDAIDNVRIVEGTPLNQAN